MIAATRRKSRSKADVSGPGVHVTFVGRGVPRLGPGETARWAKVAPVVSIAYGVPGTPPEAEESQKNAGRDGDDLFVSGQKDVLKAENCPKGAPGTGRIGGLEAQRTLDTAWRRDTITDQRPTAVVGRIIWEIPVPE